MSDAASNTSDHLDLIWGAEAIAEALNLKTTRQAFWFLENGHIPCRKIGRRWVVSRQALKAHFESNGDSSQHAREGP